MALVLGRKSGERVEIDNDIIVEVVSIKGGKVRLAIHAPASVPIWRSELKESKRKEGKE
jgi:carbon storage regulator